MTTYIKSINRKVWKVVENKIDIEDKEAPTAAEEILLQNNDIVLSAIHDVVDERTFEQIKNIAMTYEASNKLEETFEGTQVVKDAKAYILKKKFASFKMKEDKNVAEMFHIYICVYTKIWSARKYLWQGMTRDADMQERPKILFNIFWEEKEAARHMYVSSLKILCASAKERKYDAFK